LLELVLEVILLTSTVVLVRLIVIALVAVNVKRIVSAVPIRSAVTDVIVA
jgi:hypothetical protein